MEQQPTLSVQNLTIRYGRYTAVDGLSFAVQPGEIYGLLGPNGSGKSSTLSSISGALEPYRGDIAIGGAPRDRTPNYRNRYGIVPQDLALYEELTVQENLSFFGSLYGIRRKELKKRVDEALSFIQLTDQARQRVHTLSGGMQRRVNLGCALLHRPSLLLLDEPTVGLDLQSRTILFNNLRQLKDQGCAMIFTTHHLDEAEQLCDRVGVMHRGRMIIEGSVSELLARVSGNIQMARTALAEASFWQRPRLEQVLLEAASGCSS